MRRRVDRRARGLRELRVRRVAQDRAVGEDDQRERAVRRRAPSTSCAPVAESARQNACGHRAAPEQLPQLVRAARPRLADDVDGVGRRALRLGPLEEHARDRVVEELVRRRRRPEHVMVDPPPGDRVEDRLAGRRIAPVAPCDQQPRLACGWSRRASPRSSLPVIPVSHWAASTSATSLAGAGQLPPGRAARGRRRSSRPGSDGRSGHGAPGLQIAEDIRILVDGHAATGAAYAEQ